MMAKYKIEYAVPFRGHHARGALLDSRAAQRLDVTGETLPETMATQAPAVMDFRRNGSRFLISDMLHLDGGQPGGLERVVQGDAGVRVGTEIDDEGVDAPIGQRVDPGRSARPRGPTGRRRSRQPRRRASVRMSFSRSLSVAGRKFRPRASEPIEVGAVRMAIFRGFSVSMNSGTF